MARRKTAGQAAEADVEFNRVMEAMLAEWGEREAQLDERSQVLDPVAPVLAPLGGSFYLSHETVLDPVGPFDPVGS